MRYSFRTENGTEQDYCCNIDDCVKLNINGKPVYGVVIGLDDDGWITVVVSPEKYTRVYNDEIIEVNPA